MPTPDWGNVPQWLGAAGAGSLLLAYRIFLRDRANNDRAQVDRVGVWGTVEYDLLEGVPPKIKTDLTATVHILNASDLPVRITELAFEMHTRWYVPDDSVETVSVWEVIRGENPRLHFQYDFSVAPQETRLNGPVPINVDDQAPNGDGVGLAFLPPPEVVVRWAHLIDNAGRAWRVEPHLGRATRMRQRPRKWWPWRRVAGSG